MAVSLDELIVENRESLVDGIINASIQITKVRAG